MIGMAGFQSSKIVSFGAFQSWLVVLMASFQLESTLSATWKKNLTTTQNDTESKHYVLREWLKQLIRPEQQTLSLKNVSALQKVKVGPRYWVHEVVRTHETKTGYTETFEPTFINNPFTPFEDWEYAKHYPKVTLNKWSNRSLSEEPPKLYLHRDDIAELLLESKTCVAGLVLNNDNEQFEYDLYGELSKPLRLKWKHLAQTTQDQLRELVVPLLHKIYKEVLRQRVHNMKAEKVPHPQFGEVELTQSTLQPRLKEVSNLFDGEPFQTQKVVAILYYIMLAPDTAQDLFLFDIACRTVELGRLLSNHEIVALASKAIAKERNTRITGYNDSQFYENKFSEVGKSGVKLAQEESVQQLARRYREVHLHRLLRSHFSPYKSNPIA